MTAAALLGLAAFNRYRLTAPASRGVEPARLRLRRVIGVEIAVVLAILATAALWRFTPPPRTLAIASAASAPASVQLNRSVVVDSKVVSLVVRSRRLSASARCGYVS